MRYRSLAILLLVAAALAGCATLRSGVDEDDVEALLKARDYFTLRERLETMPPSPERLVVEATVLNAFNEPEASNAAIAELLDATDLSDDLRAQIQRIRRDNFLRLQRYEEAHAAALAVLDFPASSRPKRRDDENISVFLRALRNVPAQSVDVHGESHLPSNPNGHLPLRVNGHDRAFAVDTGANFSVLMRSEAVALGLDIRITRVEVGTSTDVTMLADIAVADSVTIGNVHLENVVFLVFADRALTFPNGLEIRGLIGFPIIEAMREVHFRRDGSVRIPAEPTVEPAMNIALDGLDPLVKVRWHQSDLLCRLDTGANTTDFYEPVYQRHRLLVERSGRPHRSFTAGVGGVREFDVFLLADTRIRIGGRSVRVRDVDVFTEPLGARETNYLDCNIGRDVLDQFSEYALNFESMSLVLN